MLVLRAEFRKFVESAKKAPLSKIPLLVFLYVFFWLITLAAGLLAPDQEPMFVLIRHSMLGYIVWFFAISAIGAIPQSIFQELAWGTFEHLHLSTVDIKAVFMARALVNTIQNMLIIFVFAMIVGLIHQVVIFENWFSSLVVFLLMIPGVYGLTFILGALVLLVRGMGNWLGLINFLIIIPIILPKEVIPEILHPLLSFWPVYQAAYLLRIINLGRLPWPGQAFAELAIGSAIFFTAGLLLFDVAEGVAKKRGTLGLY